jgi:hypothetical protein
MVEYRLRASARRLASIYRVTAFLPIAFVPAAWPLGAIGVAVTAVVAALLVAFLWRQADRVDVIRIEDSGVTFARRSRTVATAPWDELRSVSTLPHHFLVWTWDGGKVVTWTGFEHQRELVDEVARRAPNLHALPDVTPLD